MKEYEKTINIDINNIDIIDIICDALIECKLEIDFIEGDSLETKIIYARPKKIIPLDIPLIPLRDAEVYEVKIKHSGKLPSIVIKGSTPKYCCDLFSFDERRITNKLNNIENKIRELIETKCKIKQFNAVQPKELWEYIIKVVKLYNDNILDENEYIIEINNICIKLINKGIRKEDELEYYTVLSDMKKQGLINDKVIKIVKDSIKKTC